MVGLATCRAISQRLGNRSRMGCSDGAVGRPLMRGEALDHGGACLVQADHLHRMPVPPSLEHDPVQRADGRDVSEMGVADINDDLLHQLQQVDRVEEGASRGEEDLALHPVGPNPSVGRERRGDATQAGHLAGEEDA